jgi:mannan endo-1,4-beta-mannosidase
MRTWHLPALLAIALAACSPSDGGSPLVPDVGGGKSDGPATPDAAPVPDGGAPVEPTSSCTDLPAGDGFTCGEQVGWGKCDEPWMAGRCDRSCGRCPGIGHAVEACTDVAPGTEYTCAQQASWGKCGEPWMAGHCDLSCDRCPVAATLIDPAATAAADRLMRYLVSVHRTAILSGQQSRADADYMAMLTGRFPAIVGFDLMDYSPSRVEHGASSTEIDQAIAWSRDKGGIVTLSWHWNAPADLLDSQEWPWWKGFYTKGTRFDFARAMYDRDSTERRLLIRDIDAIAVELRRLQDAGVPVLWRPIHEAAGGWFWWGAHGPQPYLMLWRLLYDRLVNHHQLHNLIWVWNGQHRDWYPGDSYVDIVAEDIYDTERDHEPQEAAYLAATRYASMPKLVALSETGALLDPARLERSAARWSWFNLWSGDFARAQAWNEDATKRQVYTSDFVITLDELP